MKRKIAAWVLLLSACILYACGQEELAEAQREPETETGQENPAEAQREPETETGQENPAGTQQEPETETGQEELAEAQREPETETGQENPAGTQQEPEMETGQEELAEEQQEPAVTVTEDGAYRNDTWAEEDFSRFGLDGMEKFCQEEPAVYSCYAAGDRINLSAEWNGTEDFDVITQYAESLFDMTRNAGGGNYGKVYDNDVRNYVEGKTYPAFADLRGDKGSWTGVDHFFIQWYYRYGDREVQVTISGEYNESNDYFGFALYQG